MSTVISTPWTLTRTAGPAQSPVSLEAVKSSLRLSQSDTTHDDDLATSINAATEQVEQDTDRVIVNQTFALARNCFPSGNGPIQISVKPVSSIVSIQYIDTDGSPATIDGADYQLDEGRRQVYLNNGKEWPTVLQQQNAVTVNFIAGYGTGPSNIPRLIQRAVILQVGGWFFDPAMEMDREKWRNTYDLIVDRILRTSYP